MSEAREKAWETRRAKYGPRGHSGSYSRWQIEPLGRFALNLVIHLHREATLSEGQCCKALNIERVAFRRLVDAWPPYAHAFPAPETPTPAAGPQASRLAAGSHQQVEREGSREELDNARAPSTEGREG